ncbi:MAG: gamma carbonic anhydrase family protein [Planctomycetota bacterium]
MFPEPSNVVVGKDVFIAPTAYVGGNITLGDQCTVMHNVSIRGDVSAIRIGNRVNVQDGAVVHTDTDVPLHVHDDVTIGHRAVVHCKRVGAGTLIGIGAIILDGCEIGNRCIIAAGAVLPPGTIVPDAKLVVGVPGIITRDVSEDELGYMRKAVRTYIELGRLHSAGRYPGFRDASSAPS